MYHKLSNRNAILLMTCLLYVVSILTIYRLSLIPNVTNISNVLSRHSFSVLLSLIVLLLVSRIDLRFLSRYYLAFGAIYYAFMGYALLRVIAGFDPTWFITPSVTLTISVIGIMPLFIPVYVAILYSLRGDDIRSVLLALFLAVFASVPSLFMHSRGIGTFCIMIPTMLIMLTYAVHLGWFNVHIKLTIASLWIAILLLVITYFASTFTIINKSQTHDSFSTVTLPLIFSSFGIIPTIIIVGLLLSFCALLIRSALEQRELYARITALSCALTILIQTILSIASLLPWIYSLTVPLPILSYGATPLLTTGLLIGLSANACTN